MTVDGWVAIEKIKEHPKNPNKHSSDQIERLIEIIRYYGWRHPLIVSNQTGNLIVGHGRLAAAKKMGLKEVPVSYQDFESQDHEYGFMVADNGIASWAELDLAAINLEIPDLGPDFDIDMLGIKDFVIEPADKYGDKDADDTPTIRKTDIQIGDLFSLGGHRLLCGDSTDISCVQRLMNGERADMVYTDPPYGVSYDGGATKRRELEGDDTTDLYEPTCRIAFEFSIDEAPLYIWHAGTLAAAAAAAAAAAGYQIRSELIWNKNMAQFGAFSAQYKQKHEPFYYCFKVGEKVNWCGPTNEVSVWDIDRASKNEFHPTQKPTALAERAMRNHSCGLILDLYLGSGSTLIACEKTNRKCFGIEIDPQYCQVIIDRWEKFTGQKAVKLEENQVEQKTSNVSTRSIRKPKRQG